MKRTLDDIERHSVIIKSLFEAIESKLEGMSEEERDHIMRQITIAGLSTIGIREGSESLYKTVDVAEERAMNYLNSTKNSADDLLTNGVINPRLKVVRNGTPTKKN